MIDRARCSDVREGSVFAIQNRRVPGFILPTLDEVEVFCATTVGNWGISASNLKAVRFPVPPLAEQHRIVAKVDELMALCDRLEASLTTSDQTRTRLLEATLAEALAPASISEMESAE